MPKILLADDAGDEITEITIPIPFYIRVELENIPTRYKLRLIDDIGNVRGQYSGTTNRKYLEVYVPLIKLPKPGNLRIFIEESPSEGELSQEHYVSLRNLPYVPESQSQEPKSSTIGTSGILEEDVEKIELHLNYRHENGE
ncbi:MAG: hypothetical protein ACFFB2_19230 [Promethearchaeota archaeon]